MDEKKPSRLEALRAERKRAIEARMREHDPVSKRELEALEALRDEPKREKVLTPDGTMEREAHDQVRREREGWKADIRRKLDEVRDFAKTKFSLGKERERSRTDFDRSR